MTTLTRCDLCGVERVLDSGILGWAGITLFKSRVAPGKLGESQHLDLCADCTGRLREWLGLA